MAKPPGRCIFCGERGLTKQHIWPKWLKKYNLPEDTHHSQITGEATYLSPKNIKTTVTHRQGHSGSRALYQVCRTCNGGWIRRLEESVMSPVLELMRGQPIELDASVQQRLSRWICLLTIMSERTHPPTIAVPTEHRRWLRDKLEPPPGWKIFVARYVGTNWRQFICRHYGMQLLPSEDIESDVCDTQASTFVIGELCAHSFSSTVVAESDFGGYEGQAVIPIWPTGPAVIWGAAPPLGDNGVVTLSSAFFRAIDPAR